MPLIGSYRDLDVWRVSMDMVDEVLRRVKTLPRDEFELKRQIKGAAISISIEHSRRLVPQTSHAGVSESRLDRDGLERRARHGARSLLQEQSSKARRL
jgi:hypothetical protein